VQLKVDVLVVPTAGSIRAAKQATKTIPIIMVTQMDPVTAGLVDSFAQPGGNITGLATLQRDLSGKRLELLTEVIPRLSRVGVLRNSQEPTAAIGFKDYEAAAHAQNIRLQSLDVPGPKPDLEGAFREAVKGRANAIITITNFLFRHSKRITDLALKN
jgi:putative tryptophan/tyrosine transport system substrate-binding protein